MIRELTTEEEDAVDDLASQHRLAAWTVTPAVRLGINLGIKRALAVVQAADGHTAAIAALKQLME